VPLPEYAQGFVERWGGHLQGTDAAGGVPREHLAWSMPLIQDVREQVDVTCAAADFKLESLPAHLMMNFKVIDEQGRQLAMDATWRRCGPSSARSARETIPGAGRYGRGARTAGGASDYRLGLRRAGAATPDPAQRPDLAGLPAWFDQGDHCTLEVFDDPSWHALATARACAVCSASAAPADSIPGALAVIAAEVRMQASVVPALAAALPSFEELRDQVLDAGDRPHLPGGAVAVGTEGLPAAQGRGARTPEF